MNREHMAYQIYYSYLLESMTSRLNKRINKFLSFFLIILGSAVISSHFNSFIIGLLIAIISALNSEGSFEASSELSRVQSSRYLKLYNNLHLIPSDVELMQQIMKIQEDDHMPNSVIEKLAARETGKIFPDFMPLDKTTKKELLYSFLIG